MYETETMMLVDGRGVLNKVVCLQIQWWNVEIVLSDQRSIATFVFYLYSILYRMFSYNST